MDNQQWISSLIEEYERPLCRYACSLSGSIEAARDAVQETFLRLCKAERSRIEGHEAAWLFRVCRSRVFDAKRKEKPMRALTEPNLGVFATPPEQSPAELSARAESEGLVPRLMGELPARQREAIRLKFQQRLSYREIAGAMKVSESNVGFLIHSGIKTMRGQMLNLHAGVAPLQGGVS